jgi:hypothetical protein
MTKCSSENTDDSNSSKMQKSSSNQPLEAQLVQHHHMEALCKALNIAQNIANKLGLEGSQQVQNQVNC